MFTYVRFPLNLQNKNEFCESFFTDDILGTFRCDLECYSTFELPMFDYFHRFCRICGHWHIMKSCNGSRGCYNVHHKGISKKGG
jgi:hypothetical protein